LKKYNQDKNGGHSLKAQSSKAYSDHEGAVESSLQNDKNEHLTCLGLIFDWCSQELENPTFFSFTDELQKEIEGAVNVDYWEICLFIYLLDRYFETPPNNEWDNELEKTMSIYPWAGLHTMSSLILTYAASILYPEAQEHNIPLSQPDTIFQAAKIGIDTIKNESIDSEFVNQFLEERCRILEYPAEVLEVFDSAVNVYFSAQG